MKFRGKGHYSILSEILKPAHGTRMEDSKEIHVANIQLSMQGSKEFIQNVNKSDEMFILPTINIRNQGSSNILEDETVLIDLKTSNNYRLNILDMIVDLPPGLAIQSKSLSNDKKQIVLSLDGNLGPADEIILKKIRLQTTPKSKYFYRIPVRLGVKNKDREILWETENVLTYGAPLFRSGLEQVIYSNHPTSELYLFEVDLTKFHLTIKTLKSITLAMPEYLTLMWDPDSDLQYDGKGGHFLKNSRLSNNNKLLTIYISDSLARYPESAQFLIGGCRFKNIQSYKKPKKFTIKLSLNNGQSFCAADATPKWIVSPSHRAYIARQRIRESYFPFQRNNVISLVINDKTSDAVWDKNATVIKVPERRKLKSEVFEILNPSYSKGNTILSIKILKDAYGDSRQFFRFGDIIEFQGLKVKGECTLNDISLRVQTPYGYKTINRTKEKLTFRKKLAGDNKYELTVGLKKFEAAGDDLQDDFLRNWYWFPNRDLVRLNIDTNNPLEGEWLKKEVDGVKKKLLGLKNKKGDDVKYDWAFWYYLSWIKKIADEQNYDRFTADLKYPDMNNSFTSDMASARNAGYHDGMKSIFPLPGDSTDLRAARIKDFERAYDLFLNRKYLESETIVLNSMLKEGVENYIRAAFYCLLGQIGASLDDTETIEYGFGWRKTTTTYPVLICSYANEYISDPTDRRNLENWQPDIYEFLSDYEINIKAIYPERMQVERLPVRDPEHMERLVQSSSDIKFSWRPARVASILKWRYILDSPISFSKKDDQYLIRGKRFSVKKRSDFGETIQVHGGGKYSFKFSTKTSILKYFGVSALGGLLAYVWTS